MGDLLHASTPPAITTEAWPVANKPTAIDTASMPEQHCVSIEKAAQDSFSMVITNEVVRIAWFGVANVAIARFGLPVSVQWGLWAGGVAAAFAFAWLFHVTIDTPLQNRIRDWLKGRSRRAPGALQPVVSLEG